MLMTQQKFCSDWFADHSFGSRVSRQPSNTVVEVSNHSVSSFLSVPWHLQLKAVWLPPLFIGFKLATRTSTVCVRASVLKDSPENMHSTSIY